MKVERSQKLLITTEARVLKQTREAKGMIMQQAATAIGKSKPYIAHTEGGRMDVPEEQVTPRAELVELAGRLPEEKVHVLLGLAKALAEGRAVISF